MKQTERETDRARKRKREKEMLRARVIKGS